MRILAAAAILAATAFPALSMSSIRPTVDLVAMATFVDSFCPGIRMNKVNAKLAFEASGGTPDWNENPFHRTLVKQRLEILKGNPSARCEMFWDDFGPHGLREPGLIERNRP